MNAMLRPLRRLFGRYPFVFAVVAAVVLLVVNVALQPRFNVGAELASLAPLALAAMASVPAIVSGRGGIDISISPLMTFVGIFYATALVPSGLGDGIATVFVLLLGALVGAVNGILIVALRLPPVVVTLSMFFVLSGLNVKLAPQPIQLPETWFKVFAGSIGPIPGPLLIIAVPLLMWVLLRTSALGRALYTVGGNDAAAFSSGIRVGPVRVLAYALGGFIAACGGIALVGVISSATAATTSSYALLAIAAVALGGTALTGGRGGLLGTLAGAATISLLQSLLAALRVPTPWLQVSYGAMLLAAVIIGAVLSRARPEETS